jgi:hypothetical protein
MGFEHEVLDGTAHLDLPVVAPGFVELVGLDDVDGA